MDKIVPSPMLELANCLLSFSLGNIPNGWNYVLELGEDH